MQREPSDQETKIMDDMITKLADAKPYELPNAVSRAIRVVSSPQFFLRIAARADMAKDDDEREKLSALADNLVTTIQAVVDMTEDSLDERAKDVENVVKAASEPDSGEFLVPLSKERVDDMRKAMRKLEIADLDEGFLSTVDAWMNKAHQVRLSTGMLLQIQGIHNTYALIFSHSVLWFGLWNRMVWTVWLPFCRRYFKSMQAELFRMQEFNC